MTDICFGAGELSSRQTHFVTFFECFTEGLKEVDRSGVEQSTFYLCLLADVAELFEDAGEEQLQSREGFGWSADDDLIDDSSLELSSTLTEEVSYNPIP
jgi:hypothetical protein